MSILIFEFVAVQRDGVAVLDAPLLQLLIQSRFPQGLVEPHAALVIVEVDVGHEALEPRTLNEPGVAVVQALDVQRLAGVHHRRLGDIFRLVDRDRRQGSQSLRYLAHQLPGALNDKPLPVYGEGLNVRDWLYVEDHCRAIDLIIHKGRVGEVYNVGGHNEMRNIDIVKLICKELGKPESLIVHVADRKGHDMRYAIDPTKIHNELGWLPETKFADGIKKTIDWYLNNRSWWETIISGEYQDYYGKMYGNR